MVMSVIFCSFMQLFIMKQANNIRMKDRKKEQQNVLFITKFLELISNLSRKKNYGKKP